jgi:CRISPR-associated protein Csx17
MNEIALPGCTPTPLASYLKALAVLRLVAEQAGDPDATGCWRNDEFVLRMQLDKKALLRFLLHDYQPTPLIAPWNGGSGFFPKDNRDGINPLAATSCTRFASYREVITAARRVVTKVCPQGSPKNEEKAAFLQSLRNTASEHLIRWMDAAVILSDGDPRYPPLLGTGGNDGRLDFTNNFMQRLGDVFDIGSGSPKDNASGLLETALFGVPTATLPERAIGQFSPGNAGGPNATSGFEGNAKVNPWDFILMLEGAVLLAASVVRRLDSSNSAMLSAPFTVHNRLATVGAAALSDDGDARGELWMPLWAAYFTLEEVQSLFSEGRAALGARPVRDGLDFARAVARLGVDRGITIFQRYGFLMRSGKAFLATPLSRIAVRRNPRADLIDELERMEWLGRVQRYARDDKAPSAFRTASAQLDAALFALTQRSDNAAVEKVLRQLGRMEGHCANSPKTREAIGSPVPGLSSEWIRQADNRSPEFRIALALAGLSLQVEKNGKRAYLGMRPHLAPVALDGRSWDTDSRLACWSHGSLERNLAAVLHRRRLEAVRLNAEGELLRSRTGARLGDIQQFLATETDDRRIAELLGGLACVDLGRVESRTDSAPATPMPVYALLKPFFTSEAMLHALGWLPPDRTLHLPAEIPARLVGNDVEAALELAWRRLRALGVKLPGQEPPCVAGINGPRLLAALMIPLVFAETGRLLRWLDLAPETESPEEAIDTFA